MDIKVGTVFSTEAETGCVALEAPNAFGAFSGIDSDGIECAFHQDMVVSTP